MKLGVHMTPPPLPQRDNRVIRVFISSTFRDMVRERDLLVKKVFPALRSKCARRFVTFTEVDLRWGITEEQAAEGQVLPLCMAEIERSRPYFIGLLGERYGWIPDTIDPQVIEREPWLQQHVHKRTSVTELEILHGVLNNPDMRCHAFFYFRDPAYVNDTSLNNDERWNMVEHDIPDDAKNHGPAEAARRTQERQAKLAALKQRIRDSKLPLVDPYANPEALASIIHQQFDELIDRLYPEDQTPDLVTQERMQHEAHAKAKLFGCIDRPEHIAALDAFAAQAEHDGKGLVVTGDSGSGKTALLAAWARTWSVSHADHFMFQHYFGATPQSASPVGFLHRLMGELKARFDITEEIPTDPDKLRDALPGWLAQTINEGRVVLVLDGLNQVQGDEPDRRLRFLPPHFPPHVTVITSALPGLAMDALLERGWSEHTLPLASDAEISAMVGEYLRLQGRMVDVEGRPLDTPLRRQLVAAPGCKSPLFLRTVLEELRQFGSFERLPKAVANYLEAGNPQELFRRVIQRWQADFDGKDPQADQAILDLTRRALTHLWAARQGLSESEWLDLLGDGTEPLARALWASLFFAMEPHLVQRSGLYNFAHNFLRQAFESITLTSASHRRRAHLSLADYFEKHPNQRNWLSPHRVAEWPYQLKASEEWDRLQNCLTDMPLFMTLYQDATQWELTAYWQPLRDQGRNMGRAYTDASKKTLWLQHTASQGIDTLPKQLGSFLLENAFYDDAQPLLQLALSVQENAFGADHPETLKSLNNLAALMDFKGDFLASQSLMERVLAVQEARLGPEHKGTLVSLNNLAAVLDDRGEFERSQSVYERTLRTCQKHLGPEHSLTLTVMNNLGRLLTRRGEYPAARDMCEQTLRAREGTLGLDHPNTINAVSNLATVLEHQGEYAKARALFERAMDACNRVLGPEHSQTINSANNLAMLLEDQGDHSAAKSLLQKALSDSERVLGAENPETIRTLNNLACVLSRGGEEAAAQPLFERALSLRTRILGPTHFETLNTLDNLASNLAEMGDYAAALPWYEQAASAFEQKEGWDHPKMLELQTTCALLLEKSGDHIAAQRLYEKLLESRERGSDADDSATMFVVKQLAKLLFDGGKFKAAQALFDRTLAFNERVLGPDHVDTLTAANNVATALQRQGDCVPARRLFQRAVAGFVGISVREGREHPSFQGVAQNLTGLLEQTGLSKDDAVETVRELIATCTADARRLRAEQMQQFESSLNAASDAHQQGRWKEATKGYAAALKIIDEDPQAGPDHPMALKIIRAVFETQTADAELVGAEASMSRIISASEKSDQLGKADLAIDLNRYAMLLRKLGRFDEAAARLRQAIEVEDQHIPASHPKRAHRRNNLAIVLMLAGRLDDAAKANAEAWQLKSTINEGGHDMTSTRILLSRVVLCWLKNSDASVYLGQLRTLLERPALEIYGGIDPKWDAADILGRLRTKLSANQADLLTSLVEAMNDHPAKVADLARFPAWREPPPVELSIPWPAQPPS